MSRGDRFIYFLILAFPISIISIKVLGPLVYIVLAFIGIYLAISKKVSPFSIKELNLFSWVTFGYFAVMTLSIVLSNEPTNDWVHLSRKVQFLLAPFVGLVLYYANVNIYKMLQYIKITVIVLSLLVILQFVFDISFTRFDDRYSGMFNPNTFGDIMVAMILFTMVGIYKDSRKEFLLSLFSLSVGIIAVVFSGSRGSMLSLVLMLTLYGIIMFFYAKNHYKRYIGVLVLAFSIFFVSTNMANTNTRIQLAEHQIEAWNKQQSSRSSVGNRLGMYRAGWSAFLDSPWIGYGYRNANTVASKYIESELVKNTIAKYSHLHNEYLTNMVSAGIFGLFSLLILFLLPLRLFIRSLKRRDKNICVPMAGTFLILTFMVNGITHGSLQWEYQNSFFAFFLGYFLLLSQVKTLSVNNINEN